MKMLPGRLDADILNGNQVGGVPEFKYLHEKSNAAMMTAIQVGVTE
jgi:hypothetical protein